MKLHEAWLLQAGSDCDTAMLLLNQRAHECQIVAKCQQSAEKAVKGLAEVLRDAGLAKLQVGRQHWVADLVTGARTAVDSSGLAASNKKEVGRLLSQLPLGIIKELDKVVPAYPRPGALAVLNTEYPFQNTTVDWTQPSATGVFRKGYAKRCEAAARGVLGTVKKVVRVLGLLGLV